MPKQKKLLHPLFQKLLKAPFSALERRTRYFRRRRRRFRHERVGGYWLDAGIYMAWLPSLFFTMRIPRARSSVVDGGDCATAVIGLGPEMEQEGDDESAPLCIP